MSELLQSNSVLDEQVALFPEEDVRPLPVIGGAVLKATARCDYACRHCYVFEAEDQTWQFLPRKLEDETIDLVGERIAEYVEANDLPGFQVVLHGGEPFLFGKKHTERIVQGIRSAVRDTTYVGFTAHSNARLLGLGNDRSKELLDYLETNRIGVSTSLDGDRQANDFYRVYKNGESTYEDTIMGIQAVKERGLLRGILAVMILGDIDFERPQEEVIAKIQQRGLENYAALQEFEPKKIDFLFPLAHRGDLPAGMIRKAHRDMQPYANWLKPVFDNWYTIAEHKYFDPSSPKAREYAPDIRTFSSIISRLAGKPSAVETIGSLGEVSSVVIDADGQYGIVDTLASAAEGEYRLGSNVRDTSIDTAVRSVVEKASGRGMMTLPKECQACPVRTVCQGGYAPHRYDPDALPGEQTYAKKTIYSSNLLDLISHINGSYVASKIKYAGIQSQRQYYGDAYDAIAF
jgi:uncharacterized protein